MSKIKTDSDVVRVARQIDSHLALVRGLMYDLQESEHPRAEEIYNALCENSLGAFAWATHVVSHELLHPENWETGVFGVRYIGRKTA